MFLDGGSNKTKNSRKRLSSDSLPTLDMSSCNGAKKSKLESKAISALVAYGSDSSDGENEDEENEKCNILQRLQQKAEMFKQKELDELSKDKSPSLLQTSHQPDILDIIGEEVPPDYEIENTHESTNKKTTGDIFEILENEVPPDYVKDDTPNNHTEEENIEVESESKLQPQLQSIDVDNDLSVKHRSNTDEKTNAINLDLAKDDSLKSFSLIANYGEDVEDSGKH